MIGDFEGDRPEMAVTHYDEVAEAAARMNGAMMATKAPSKTEPYVKALRKHMLLSEAIMADDTIPLRDRAAILRRVGQFCLDVAENVAPEKHPPTPSSPES